MIDTSAWPLEDLKLTAKDRNCVRIISILDPHMSPHNPPVYKVDYWPVVKETLRTVFRYAAKVQADVVLWGGDLFHLKTSSRNPNYFMAEVISLFRENRHEFTHAGIAGNHDLLYGCIEKGFEGQPISVLEASGAYNLLDKREILIRAGYGDGDDLAFNVRVAGASYYHAQASTAKEKTKKGADYLVTTGHFWFGAQSGEFFGEPIYGPDYLGNSDTDVYVIGHHHEDQGVREVGGKFYDSHGSISRTGNHGNDLTRKPCASLIEITHDGIKIQLLRPKVPPAEDLMDLEKRAAVMEEKKEMETFISQLDATKVETTDPREILTEMQPSEKIRARVLHYITKAEEAS